MRALTRFGRGRGVGVSVGVGVDVGVGVGVDDRVVLRVGFGVLRVGFGARLCLCVCVALLCLSSRPAAAEPDNQDLVLVGLAMAPPTYLIGVTLHEGSHALAAKLVGGEVTEVRLFPPGIDPKAKKFRFGWTYVRGLETRNEKIFFYLAPKITDGILLGGFAALILTNTWPDNRYAQLALTVGATGLWVDFSKDVILFSPHNDVVKAFKGWCMTGWKQLPGRLVYGALVVASGYTVARGYQKTFGEQGSTMSVPLLTAVF